MKREIEFRGKDIYTEEWIYGNLVNIEEDRYAVLPVINTMRGETIAMYEVNPDTVGQFTGLYDFYGKEIYEGDIIESGYDGSGMDYRKTVRHMVGYNPKDASFTAEFIGAYPNCGSIRQSWINQFGKRIVGNIHDNPELLKGGAK